MIQLPEVQYKHQIKKGVTVTYGNKVYRVQDDRGYLHIIVTENNKRKKISIDALPFFEPATIGDYIFNGWFEVYTEEEYFSYVSAEKEWVM